MKYENKYFIFDNPEPMNWKYPVKTILAATLRPVYKIITAIAGPNCIAEKKYKVSICAIFRDEATYLKEWIEFHKIIGVEHFYLYNNFSKDNYQEILRPYIECGEVTLIEWPYYQGQMEAYKNCLTKYGGESSWIGFIDLDEFVVPIKHDNIYDYLRKFSHQTAVLIYWRLFGSSGYINRNVSGLVTEDFVACWPKHTNIGKCFFNTAYQLSEKYTHDMHLLYGKVKSLNIPPVNIAGNSVLWGQHRMITTDFPMQINHYYTKSWEEYKQKILRGDAFFQQSHHISEAFFEHEMKCTSVDYSVYKYLIKLKIAMRKF